MRMWEDDDDETVRFGLMTIGLEFMKEEDLGVLNGVRIEGEG